MTMMRIKSNPWMLKLAATAFLASSVASLPSGAQENGSGQQLRPTDRIVDSEVREEQVRSEDDTDRIIAAIENSNENTNRVRKVTDLDRVDIIFMADSTPVEGGPPEDIAAKLSENSGDVDSLRRELESNALFYHAINSRNILMRDVVAIEFDSDKHVVIFAATAPPQ